MSASLNQLYFVIYFDDSALSAGEGDIVDVL